MPLNYIIKVYIVVLDVKITNCSNVQVIWQQEHIVLMNAYLVENNIHKIPQNTDTFVPN